ncbi:4Fe-4S binding protein [Clostridium estertheticum]|uniref:4Fe-4S binding protein n=1 Tax=Clostridium estertheticum TaxID=238834 RepID=UPI001C6E59BD|nr:4Fe-4S binding protein [Clostridium estertheticum]MBW9150723.1 4Fe-4S binding protein [Clostridium estertheticum]MCB2305116.1 4Fe-4S binding protein [Clostridium estertheticum]MCB2343614.1 4Fe-4S binding protein [Clostridium estertheticum]MCB2348534.1 4Fe-4S binding protein [Clostridium estertheticum]WAG47478.1 4Fe-4S binding protein [Clostridium estertheticum]
MKNNKYLKYLRWLLLAFFLIMVTREAYLHQVQGGGVAPSVHALCPYGALETFYSLVFGGTFLQKIFSGTMILLGITLVLAVIFRRGFCGLICPFGALQEFFGIIGKKIFHKRFIMPIAIDKPLRYLKYIVLVVTIYFAWKTAGLWMDPYDPWAAYGHLSAGYESLTTEYLVGTIVLVIILVGSLLYDRFFCKYLCPMGAVYGIVSKISPSKIVRDKDICINCNLCSKSCPMNIDVAEVDKVISTECISCQVCVLTCPKVGALKYKTGKKTLKTLTVIIFVVGLFFMGVFISKTVGVFEVLPKQITQESQINVEEIKGYMTIKDVSIGTKIEIEEVYKKLGIPASVPESTKLKDVQNFVEGFEVEVAKEKLK